MSGLRRLLSAVPLATQPCISSPCSTTVRAVATSATSSTIGDNALNKIQQQNIQQQAHYHHHCRHHHHQQQRQQQRQLRRTYHHCTSSHYHVQQSQQPQQQRRRYVSSSVLEAASSFLPKTGDLTPEPDASAAYAAAAIEPTHVTRLRFNAKGYDHVILDSYVEFIRRTAVAFDVPHTGRVPLPTHRRITTLLKSPHVYKQHRVQFEQRTHHRMIEVKNISGATAKALRAYVEANAPAGVSVRIMTETLESLPTTL